MSDLSKLLAEAVAKFDALTPAKLAELHRQQAEASWPKARFRWVDGAKIYDSYEDYCND